jgi:UDP-N-acetylmuramate--alanine ligase
VFCVFQPHQHSRTRTLLDDFSTCFRDATLAIIPDIYSVRDSEEEKRLTSSETLVDRIIAAGHRAMHLATFPRVVEYLKQNAAPGDLILTIGAGNVCEIAHELANLEPPSHV